ncbi:MAG TPA: hypothetical protein VJG31_02960 [Candidatus Nanoarchaeia archaeon]|nr:hypothetical protein [Candidatus Nanoarchaeia archaeon]
MEKKIIIFCLFLLLTISSVSALPDLIIEDLIAEPLPQENFWRQDILLSFSIKNIGDQAVKTRLPYAKSGTSQRGWSALAQDLGGAFLITNLNGEIRNEEPTEEKIQVADGNIVAPLITLNPGEKVEIKSPPYKLEALTKYFTFSFPDSGAYKVGYQVDPNDEIKEANEDNNLAEIEIPIEFKHYVKGPNEEATKYLPEMKSNQYYLAFPKKGSCFLIEEVRKEVCLEESTDFYGVLSISGIKGKVWHFFGLFSFTSKIGNYEFKRTGAGILLTEKKS